MALIAALLISLSPLNAKTTPKVLSKRQVKTHKTQYLEKTYIRALKDYERKNRVRTALKETNLPKRQVLSDQTIIELHDIINGRPQFKKTTNVISAETISVDQIHEGGPHSGIQLSGEGVRLGIWDSGKVRDTHQEFEGRVTIRDTNVELSDHATHVAGTMIGGGISFTGRAKGMAYNATLDSYEWTNPEIEMQKATNEGELFAANHSWGFSSGWEFDSTALAWVWFGDEDEIEDEAFGKYTHLAQAWDELSHAFLYLNIVKAAGNDRGSSGGGTSGSHFHFTSSGTKFIPSGSESIRHQSDDEDSGYDTMDTLATAKNIITVGAIESIPGGYTDPSDAVIASFSSWGPADDGRIKPDIVAKGVGTFSSFSGSDSRYATANGTSMASPAITGGIGVLLEHQKNLHGNKKLLSSTIKSLIINTADEAGENTGPDYMFGWGVANFEDAAVLMSENKIEDADYIIELLIENEKSQQFDIISDGLNPIQITLVWLDPAGPSQPEGIDQNLSVLVNDMDIRIKDPDDNFHKPWRLDLAQPTAAAIATDNTIDNVEQILIPSPGAGTYTVLIGHKNTLSGFRDQPVSIVINSTISNQKNYTVNEFGDITGLENEGEESPTEDAEILDSPQIIEFRNGPNPFNPTIESTKFYFQMSEAATARAYIYSLNGEEVMTREMEVIQGENVFQWDGKNKNGNTVANGVYIAYIYAENESGSHKAKRKVAVIK